MGIHDFDVIHIGYAGRLEVSSKRADLIIKLIEQLELKDIMYEFHIAGTGKYFYELQNFVFEKRLENKVFLHGQLLREKMPEFWKNKDVFVSTSDKEGTCISMIEAMASGVVPVVTEFSSSKEYVKIPDNGYVVSYGDMKAMANQIEKLYKHPERIIEKGKKCSEYIKTHCGYDSYEVFLLNLCY